MDRAAVFVDAGYLFAQGSILIAGTKLKRSETVLDELKALEFMKALSAKITSLPLLRIYWYDGTDSGPTPVHTSLAFKPDVKVRLGIVNSFGEQKGVDSLIVSDLIDLSRNHAMCDAVLFTGDEDIRVGVQKAQEVGVRVHLVGLEPAQQNQSRLLRQEADSLHEIMKKDVEGFLQRSQAGTQNAPLPIPPLPSGADPIEFAAQQFAAGLSSPDRARVVANTSGVPPDIDGQLLKSGAASCGGKSLSETQKRNLRRYFIASCKQKP